uniref:Uncharacterized protein n=1 Tax=Romanomermis culicivorax TaxID=13658 RepID=A0A915KRG1_ROMCU
MKKCEYENSSSSRSINRTKQKVGQLKKLKINTKRLRFMNCEMKLTRYLKANHQQITISNVCGAGNAKNFWGFAPESMNIILLTRICPKYEQVLFA